MLPSSSVSCQGGSKVLTMGKKRGKPLKGDGLIFKNGLAMLPQQAVSRKKKCNLGEALFASNFENPNVVAPKDLQREEISFQKHRF